MSQTNIQKITSKKDMGKVPPDQALVDQVPATSTPVAEIEAKLSGLAKKKEALTEKLWTLRGKVLSLLQEELIEGEKAQLATKIKTASSQRDSCEERLQALNLLVTDLQEELSKRKRQALVDDLAETEEAIKTANAGRLKCRAQMEVSLAESAFNIWQLEGGELHSKVADLSVIWFHSLETFRAEVTRLHKEAQGNGFEPWEGQLFKLRAKKKNLEKALEAH